MSKKQREPLKVKRGGAGRERKKGGEGKRQSEGQSGGGKKMERSEICNAKESDGGLWREGETGHEESICEARMKYEIKLEELNIRF